MYSYSKRNEGERRKRSQVGAEILIRDPFLVCLFVLCHLEATKAELNALQSPFVIIYRTGLFSIESKFVFRLQKFPLTNFSCL